MLRVLLATTVLLFTSASSLAATPAQQARAVQLAQEALDDTLGYELVASLTTEVGPRLAGTEAEQSAQPASGNGGDEIDDLKRQMEEMQKRLDRLSQKDRS